MTDFNHTSYCEVHQYFIGEIGRASYLSHGPASSALYQKFIRLDLLRKKTSSRLAMAVEGEIFPLQADVAQRVGRGIALLFHDNGTRRG
jgi:hypothetical protein